MNAAVDKVAIEIEDFTGNRRAELTLPAERTIGEVRPQILESLRLDCQQFAGDEPITWMIYNRSGPEMPILSDQDVVGRVLRTGETVRVVPNIVAGG